MAQPSSFADRLRDALVVDHPDAVVLGHTTEADTVANEEVRIFGGREGMNDANFHRIFPRTWTAPARAEFEAERIDRSASATSIAR